MTDSLAPQPPLDESAASTVPLKEWWSATPANARALVLIPLVAVVLVLLLSLAIGSAASTRASQLSDEVQEQAQTIELRDDSIARLQTQLAAVQDGVEEREAELAAAEAAVQAAEAEVASREDAVAGAEEAAAVEAAANTMTNGVHVVGTTVQPGTWQTTGGNGRNSIGCYYAFLSGTGSDSDIIDNNIVTGPAIVTLNPGDIFESSSCADWQRIG